MKTIRLAEILSAKYKVAMNAVDLESSIRKQIPVLWNYPNKIFPILKACADSGISNAKSADERKAFAGYKFCKEVISIIDYIKLNWLNISMGELRNKIENLIKLIHENKDLKFTPNGNPTKNEEGFDDPLVSVQFPHVAELIYAIFPINKKNDLKYRNDMQSKARTGLSRISSLATSILGDLDKLEMMNPELFSDTDSTTEEDVAESVPGRFSPQRGQLSNHDVVDFIRQHGDEYGINSTEDWAKLFLDDPIFKQEITTVINAINRGHYPRGAQEVKTQIDDILRRHKERKAASNAHLFGDVV